MPNVWVVMPSARPVEEVRTIAQRWLDQGYLIALWRDTPIEAHLIGADMVQSGEYTGYAASANALVKKVLALGLDTRWFVCAADDIEPDPNKTADEIADECSQFFGGLAERGAKLTPEPGKNYLLMPSDKRGTFGVMQPTGDRWGADDQWAKHKFPDAPAYIDRICGSAWVGREFIERTYGGKGPFWPEYKHMYCDEELQEVAKKLGVLWQRPDLTQYHRHWIREKPSATAADCPEFLKSVNSPEAWREAKALFDQRKTQGFPGAI